MSVVSLYQRVSRVCCILPLEIEIKAVVKIKKSAVVALLSLLMVDGPLSEIIVFFIFRFNLLYK